VEAEVAGDRVQPCGDGSAGFVAVPLAIDSQKRLLEDILSRGLVADEPPDKVVEADPVAGVQCLEGPRLVGLRAIHQLFVGLIVPLPQGSLHLFQGIGAELVRHALFDAVALDDVTRLRVVGQDDGLVPDGAACLLHLAHGPDAIRFAHPERHARSVGAVKDIAALDPDREIALPSSAVAGYPGHRPSPSPPRNSRYVMPRSRSIFPRSKPTITSPSMTVTGVARTPSFSNSSSACGSSRMFFAVKWIPF